MQAGTTVEAAAARFEYACASCGYGAVAAGPPGGCPRCGHRSWTFGRHDGPTVRRVGPATFLLAPPPELGPAGHAALTMAVAALASDRPEIVLDLTDVAAFDESLVRLLLRLAALARGAGGRLLAACPASDSEWLELHPLDGPTAVADEWLERRLGG